MKLSKKELERRGLELRLAYMQGYEAGFKAATPMDVFVNTLMQLTDKKVINDIRKWSDEEFESRKDLIKKMKSLEYRVIELESENEELKEDKQ